MLSNIWVTFDVLEWRADKEGSTCCDEQKYARPYEIWSHAEQILSKPTKDLDLVDAITTLKRTIDHRSRHLNELYSFKTIPIKDKPSSLLESLSYFEIIRPIMLQRLIEIRNEVEHQDASPPSQNVCKEFLEFTWYFLRSTDQLVKSVADSFRLIPFGEDLFDYDYWLNVHTGPEKKWTVEVRGWLYPSLFSQTKRNDWIMFESEKIERRDELFKRLRLKEEDAKKDKGRGRKPEDIYINGVIKGPVNCVDKIFRKYFAL
jgi:hypothetical protein